MVAKTETKAKHPKFHDMIIDAITSIKDRKGASRPAIHKFIVDEYKIDENVAKIQIKQAIKRGISNGGLIQEGQRFKKPSTKSASKTTQSPKKAVKKATPSKKKVAVVKAKAKALPAKKAAPKKATTTTKKAAPAKKATTTKKTTTPTKKATTTKKAAPVKKAAPKSTSRTRGKK